MPCCGWCNEVVCTCQFHMPLLIWLYAMINSLTYLGQLHQTLQVYRPIVCVVVNMILFSRQSHGALIVWTHTCLLLSCQRILIPGRMWVTWLRLSAVCDWSSLQLIQNWQSNFGKKHAFSSLTAIWYSPSQGPVSWYCPRILLQPRVWQVRNSYKDGSRLDKVALGVCIS